MKKIIFVLSLGTAVLGSAKNSEIELNSLKSMVEKIEKTIEVDRLIPYGYLYQSTCGWTFTMSSNIAIQDMTESEYREYWLDVIDNNERVCKLHGEKPVYNFTDNLTILRGWKKRGFEKIIIFNKLNSINLLNMS